MFNKEMEGKRIFGYSKSTMDKPIVTKILQEVKDQQEILKLFEEYDINFTNSYSIGSFGDKMSYFDMVKKLNQIKKDKHIY